MTRQRQGDVLGWLAFFVIVLLGVLTELHPTVGGNSLRDVELTVPLSHLQHAEHPRFFGWLLIDDVFTIVYTVFFTGALRWLAADAPRPWLNLLGRSLSWLTAFAILFDLLENALLWTGATLGTTVIPTLLTPLVSLKWLSAGVFLTYFAIWLVLGFRAPKKTWQPLLFG